MINAVGRAQTAEGSCGLFICKSNNIITPSTYFTDSRAAERHRRHSPREAVSISAATHPPRISGNLRSEKGPVAPDLWVLSHGKTAYGRQSICRPSRATCAAKGRPYVTLWERLFEERQYARRSWVKTFPGVPRLYLEAPLISGRRRAAVAGRPLVLPAGATLPTL
ncbi:hypothetical protein NHX12_021799 [Muraenolepis orangiensis]|uniref:Uncharacterized protein n=1 Tax=Muraenolepis orangiensis TaxID=630683 RepID=A0A9Q0IVG9_9TELE|nr:hypothetical protein NHX12_021799 [Muraenolepis orangiensis]